MGWPGSRICPENPRIPCRMLRSNLDIFVLCGQSVLVTDKIWAIPNVGQIMASATQPLGNPTSRPESRKCYFQLKSIEINAKPLSGPKIGNLATGWRNPKPHAWDIISGPMCEVGKSKTQPASKRKRRFLPHTPSSKRKRNVSSC